jgi:ABC-type transport system involved in multi-copper enzyme maturation permease subunit
MKNILQYELFKLKRNKGFLIVMPLALLFAIVMPILNWIGANGNTEAEKMYGGKDAIIWSSASYQIWSVFILVLVTSLIVTEYARGTMRNSVMSGSSRNKIFIAKTLICCTLTVIIFFMFFAADTVALSIQNGFGAINFGRYILTIFVVLLQAVAVAFVTVFFAELTRNTGAVFGIMLGVTYSFAIMLMLAITHSWAPLKVFAELYVGANIETSADFSLSPLKIVKYILTAVVTIGLSFWGGLVSFKGRDVK